MKTNRERVFNPSSFSLAFSFNFSKYMIWIRGSNLLSFLFLLLLSRDFIIHWIVVFHCAWVNMNMHEFYVKSEE